MSKVVRKRARIKLNFVTVHLPFAIPANSHKPLGLKSVS